MRIAIGSDHAGFELKKRVREFLAEWHYDTLDMGTRSTAPVDYPDYAQAVGRAVQAGEAARGIVICGSGVGASVAANKVPGVRAGVCHDTYSARQGVEHDDINVLVLGGRVIGAELARNIVTSFLSARFTGEERHRRRLAKVIAMENPLSALEAYGGYRALNIGSSGYGKFDERIYTDLSSEHPIDLCRYQVANCYMGRAGLINSGGAAGKNDFHDAVATAVINKRAGGTGLISGRKAFQRPMKEGVALLTAVQEVYLCNEISVA